MDVVSGEAKCERLEEIAIDDDSKKFFRSKLSLHGMPMKLLGWT